MSQPDFLFCLTPGDLDWDIESLPNIFTCTFKHNTTGQVWYFEISPRRDDLNMLMWFIVRCIEEGCRWVGYNSLGYDYPVMHFIYRNQKALISYADIYRKSKEVIDTPWNNRFSHMIWDNDQVVPQIDLYKVHHFDNPSKSTKLKTLEFNMRMDNVEDGPVEFDVDVPLELMDSLKGYNINDVDATGEFHDRSKGQIVLRESLSKKFNMNMLNFSDVKIGEQILVHELEKVGVDCYMYVDGKKKKRQTQREEIRIADVILPYVRFEHPQFYGILHELQGKVITETKGVFKDMVANVGGIEYEIGTGGLHGSVKAKIIRSTSTHQIVDVDVASYYPNLSIKNNLYPEHLGQQFCTAYLGVYETRKTFPKGSPENEAFKLALNGSFGGSNNEYSPFLDPQYTMSITINGQLLLCMLIEQLIKIPGLSMIQANTDGVTYLCPREYLEHARNLNTWWEGVTQLELEEALYSRMWVRDVNSYIAEYEGGKLKRIGAYAYETADENPGTRELPYHKNWGTRVVQKAAEAFLVSDTPIRKYVENHTDIYDFFNSTKVPGGSTLEWGGETIPNICRYYCSTDGEKLEKVMPATGPIGAFKRASKVDETLYNSVLAETGYYAWDERIHTKNKSTYNERRMSLDAGWLTTICNNVTNEEFVQSNYHPENLNYEYYIQKAEKLVNLMEFEL